MPSLSRRLIIDYSSLVSLRHLAYARIASGGLFNRPRIDWDIKRFPSFLITIRFILNSRQFDGIKERTKESVRWETRGYIDLWRGWISDPRKVYRADDDALRSEITCRRLYANFTGRVSPRGINRPSFKPSALLVLPFLNLLTASSIDAASEGISPRYAYRHIYRG